MLCRLLIVQAPTYNNIRILKTTYCSKNKMQNDLFMTFDQFKDQLGSWTKPL